MLVMRNPKAHQRHCGSGGK